MRAVVLHLLAFVIPLATGQCKLSAGDCPAGTPIVNCKVAPCEVTKCPRYPNAICVNDYCGGCNARFYVNNKEVTAFCPSSPAVCPCGSPPVQCQQQPCRVKTCPAFPSATCVDDYCGGCNAIFFNNKTDVTKQCMPKCPVGKTLVNCFAAPCQVNKCPRYPNATCVDDYCGGCFARYFVNGRDVTRFCPSRPPVCEDGNPPVKCVDEPCRVTRCQGYPNATCVNDYCGGCNARFFINKTEVTKQCCTSPTIKPCTDEGILLCIIDPCDPRIASCDNVPTATCISDVCFGCKARWFLPDCRQVTDSCNRTST